MENREILRKCLNRDADLDKWISFFCSRSLKFPVIVGAHGGCVCPPVIGRRPYAAFGNSTGDRQMLEWTAAGAGARLKMLLLHDDAAREYAYGPAQGLPDTKIGTFTPALYDEAKKNGWTVISMKNDWKRIFPFEQSTVTAIDILLEPDATMLKHAE